MTLDPTTSFFLPPLAHRFIQQYASPEHEASVAKDIPLTELPMARSVMRMIQTLTGRRLRVIYRGPRYDSQRSWCRRQHARRFAVYFC